MRLVFRLFLDLSRSHLSEIDTRASSFSFLRHIESSLNCREAKNGKKKKDYVHGNTKEAQLRKAAVGCRSLKDFFGAAGGGAAEAAGQEQAGPSSQCPVVATEAEPAMKGDDNVGCADLCA